MAPTRRSGFTLTRHSGGSRCRDGLAGTGASLASAQADRKEGTCVAPGATTKGPPTMKTLVTFAAAVALLTAASTIPLAHAADNDKAAALVKDLSSKDESVRLNAALALGKLGKDAVGPVSAALTDSDP